MRTRWEYISYRIAVPQAFEQVFSHFYVASNATSQTVTKTLLPSYQTILVFNFGNHAVLHTRQGGHLEIDKCLVLGPIQQAFDYSLPPGAEILVANLIDDAFYRFFGPAAIAATLPLHPDDLLDENCFTALWLALAKLGTTEEKAHLLLEFCKPYLKDRHSLAEQLSSIDTELFDPIKAIARATDQTARNVQLHHKKLLGYSAKALNRYRRFLKAVDAIQHLASTAQPVDWFDIIHTCGYYDQSQLIHDFQHYLHLSPTRYLTFQQHICNPVT